MTPPLSPNNLNTPPQQTPTPPKQVDYFGLKLGGVDDNFILQKSSQDNSIPVVPSKDVSWQKYGDSVYKGDKTRFESDWNNANSQLANFNSGVYDGSVSASQNRTNDSLRFKDVVQTPFSDYLHGNTQYSPQASSVAKDDRFIMSPLGYYTQVKSDDQYRDDRGIVKISDGKTITREEWSKIQAKKINDNGGLFSSVNKEFLSTATLGFAGDLKSSPDLLVADYDENGQPIWRSAGMTERVVQSHIRPVFGPRKMYNSWYADFFGSFLNNFVTNVPSMFGSLAENTLNLGMAMDEPLLKKSMNPEQYKQFKDKFNDNPVFQWARTSQNLSGFSYQQESQNQQMGREGTFGRDLGAAVGMICQAVLTGGIGRAVGLAKGGLELTASALDAATVTEGSMSAIARQQIMQNSIETTNRVIFSIAMADGFHQGAKELGIDPEKAAFGYFGSLGASYFLMGKGHAWFSPETGGLFKQSLDGTIKDMYKKELTDAAYQTFGKTAAELTSQETSQLSKQVSKGIFRTIISAAKVPGQLLKKGMTSGFVPLANTLSASSEMAAIHMANNFIQISSDYYTSLSGKDKTDGFYGDTDENFFKRLTNGMGGAFEQGLMMGAISTGMHFAYGGKMMSQQEYAQKMTINDLVVQGKLPEARRVLAGMYASSEIGPHWIDAKTSETIQPGAVDPDTGERPQSVADVTYQKALQDLDNTEQVYRDSGLKDWRKKATENKYIRQSGNETLDSETASMLGELINPNSLAREGIEYAIRGNELSKQLREATTDQQKADIQSQIDLNSSKIADILSDKRSNEIIRDGMVRSHLANRVFDHGSAGVNMVLSEPDNLKFHQVTDSFNTSVSSSVNQFLSDKADAQKIIDDVVPSIQDTLKSLSGANTSKALEIASHVAKTGSIAAAEHLKALSDGLVLQSDKRTKEILDELKSKFQIEAKPEEDLTQQDILENAISEVPQEHKAEYNKHLEEVQNAMSASEKIAGLKPEERTIEDVKHEAFLSSNTGTTDQPVLTPYDTIVRNLKESALTSTEDVQMLMNIRNDISRRMRVMDINANVYSHLNDSVTGIDEKNRTTASYMDSSSDKSVISELQKHLDDVTAMIDKSAMASQVSRMINEGDMKEGHVRNSYIFNKEILNAFDHLYPETKTVTLLKQYNTLNDLFKQISDIGNSLEKKNDGTSIWTVDALEKRDELYNKAIEVCAVIDTQVHYLFHSNKGSAQTIFDALTYNKGGKKGMFAYDINGINDVPGGLQDIGPMSYQVDRNSNGLPIYNDAKPYKNVFSRDTAKDADPKKTVSLSDDKSYLYRLFTNHINRVNRISSKDFYNAYQEYVDSNLKNKQDFITPSFEQRQSIHSIVAFMHDSSNLFVNPSLSVPFNDNELVILGFAGAGKTSRILPSAIETYKRFMTRKYGESSVADLKMTGSAPSAPQVDLLRSSISRADADKGFEFTTVSDLTDTASKSFSRNPGFIFIDEASELSDSELMKIAINARKNNTKVIYMGDASQLSGDKNFSIPEVLYARENTVPVVDIFRSGVYDITRLQQQYRDVSLNTSYRQVSLLPTSYTVDDAGHAKQGVLLRGFDAISRKDQLGKFVTDVRNQGRMRDNTFMIVTDDNDRLNVISDLVNNHSVDRSFAESHVKTITRGENTAKGLTLSRVYVNLDPEKLQKDYYKAQLTASSRATDFVDIVTDIPQNRLPGSKEVKSLIDTSDDYRKAEDQRIKEYGLQEQSRLASMNETLKQADNTESKEPPVVKDTTEKVIEPDPKETSQNPLDVNTLSGLDKASKSKKPVQKRTSVNSALGSNDIIHQIGNIVTDAKGIMHTISHIEIDKNGEVFFKLDNKGRFIRSGDFAKYSPFNGNRIREFSNVKTPADVRDQDSFVRKSIENHASYRDTYSSAVNPHDENTQPLHDAVKVDFLNAVKAFSGESDMLLKRTYHRRLELGGKTFEHVITVSMDDSNPQIRNFLDAKASEYKIGDRSKLPILGTMFLPDDFSNRDFTAEYKANPLYDEQKNAYEKYKFDIRKEAYSRLRPGDNTVDLGKVKILSATPGNVRYGKTPDAVDSFRKVSDLLRNPVMTKNGNVYRSGNVYFYEPVFIMNPDEVSYLSGVSSVTKYNGNFEPGYYLVYSHDASMQNAGMVKLRSAELDSHELGSVTDLIRNNIANRKQTSVGFITDGSYWKDVNRFISANRYALFEKPASPDGIWKPKYEFTEEGLKNTAKLNGMKASEIASRYDGIGDLIAVKPEKVKGKDVSYFNFRNFYGEYGQKSYDEKLPADKMQQRADALADALEYYHKSSAKVKLRDFATIDPKSKQLADRSDFDKLEMNVEGFSMPQILTSQTAVENTGISDIKENPGDTQQAPVSFDMASEPFATKDFEYHPDYADLGKDHENNADGFYLEPASEPQSDEDEVEEKYLSRDQRAKDFNKVLDIFNNQHRVTMIQKMIGNNIVNLSHNTRLPYFRTMGWSQAKDAFYEKVKEETTQIKTRNYNVIRDGETVKVHMSEVAYDDASVSDALMRDYVVYHLSDQDVYDKFIKKIFPKTILGSEAIAKEVSGSDSANRLGNYFADIDREKLSGDSSIQTGSDRKAASFTDHVRLLVSNTNYNEYVTDADGKRTIVNKGSTTRVNENLATGLFVQLSRIARFESVGNPDRMKVLGDLIKTKAQAAPGTIEGNTLWSLYDAIFNDPNPDSMDLSSSRDQARADGNFSYTAWSKYPELVYNVLSKENPSITREQVFERSRNHYSILSALHNAYISIATKDFDSAVVDKNGEYHVATKRPNDISRIKTKINRDFVTSVYDLSADHNAVNGELKQSKKIALFDMFNVEFTPKDSNDVVNTLMTRAEIDDLKADGITIRHEKQAPLQNGFRNEKDGLYSVSENGTRRKLVSYSGTPSLDKDFTNADAREIFNFFGQRANISDKTLNTFMLERDNPLSVKYNRAIEDTTSVKISDGGINRNKLATIYKTWFDQLTDPNAMKDNIMGIVSSGSSSFTDAFTDDVSMELGSAGSHFWLVNDIANVEAYSKAGKRTNSFIDGNGNKIHTDTKGSFLDYAFGGFTDRVTADRGLKEKFSLAIHLLENKDTSPFFDSRTGIYLNPFVDPQGQDLIITSMNRLGYVSKGNNSLAISDMNTKEYLNTAIHAYFIDNIVRKTRSGSIYLKNQGREYSLPHPNMADTHTPPVFGFRSSEDKVPVIVDVKSQQKSAKTNWPVFTEHFTRLFDVRRRHQMNAINVMHKAIHDAIPESAHNDFNANINTAYENPEYLQRVVDVHINSNPDAVKAFRRALETGKAEQNAHYKYDPKTNRIVMGNDTLMNFTDASGSQVDDVFTFDNFKKVREIAKIQDENVRNSTYETFFKNILSDRMNGFVNMIMKSGMSVSEITRDFFQGDKTSSGREKPFAMDIQGARGETGYRIPGTVKPGEPVKVMHVNPFYESYYLSWLTHMAHLTEFTSGNVFAQSSFSDIGKRNYTLLTPGNMMDTSNPYGVGVKSKYAIIDDTSVMNNLVRLLTDKSPRSSSVKNTDGWQLKLSAHAHLEYESTGGVNGPIKAIEGSQKHIYNDVDVTTGKRVLIKSAALTTASYRNHSTLIADIEKRMLGPELYSKLEEFRFDDAKLARYIAENKLQNTYVAALVHPSAAKLMADAPINPANAEGFMTFDTDNSKHLIVLDANKDVKDDSSKQPIQIITEQSDGPNNHQRANEIKRAQSEYIRVETKRIQDHVNKEFDGDWGKWMKSLGSESAHNMGVIGNFVNIINDAGFSIHSPGIAERIRPLLIQQLNDLVKPSFDTGGSYVQVPGDFVDMVESNVDIPDLFIKKGDRFTGKAFAKRVALLQKLGVNIDTDFKKDPHGLATVRHFNEAGQNIEDTIDPAKLQDPNWKPTPEESQALLATIVKSKPAETLLRNKQYDKFGFNNIATDPLYYKNFSVDDILSLEMGEGKIIRYDHLGETREERMQNASKIFSGDKLNLNNTVGMRALVNALVEKGDLKIDQEEGLDLSDKMPRIIDYYEGFMKSLDLVMSRIPASTPGSGGRYTTVDFAHDTSNIAFISSKKNVIDGSDYDVDELHTISRFIGDLGENMLVNEQGKVKNESLFFKNKIVDGIFDYYNDPKNIINYTDPITTNTIENIISDLKLDERKKGEISGFINDFGSHVKQFIGYQSGANATGTFASSIRTFMYIYNAYLPDNGQHFDMTFHGNVLGGSRYTRFMDQDGVARSSSGQLKLNWLAELLQSAVDNGKLDQLGKIFANSTTSNMLSAMGAIGIDAQSAIKFLTHNTTREVIGDIMQGKGLDDKTRDVYHVIDSWEHMYNSYQDKLEEIDAQEPDEQKRNLLKKELTDKLRGAAWLKQSDIPVSTTKEQVPVLTQGLTPDESQSGVPNEHYLNDSDADMDTFTNRDDYESLGFATKINYSFDKVPEWIDGKIKDIADLRQLMLAGDAMGRMANILSIAGSKGIRSGAYDFYAYNENLKEVLNPSRRFLETRRTKPQVNGFDLPSELYDNSESAQIKSQATRYMENNEMMQRFIDAKKVIQYSPNLVSYIKLSEMAQQIFEKSIIYEHPEIKQRVLSQLPLFNQDRIWSKDAYNNVFGKVNNLLTNMYLSEHYSSTRADKANMSNLVDEEGTLYGENYPSDPQSRAIFLGSLPDLVEDIKAHPEKYNPSDPQSIVSNKAIDNIIINSSGNSMDKYLAMFDAQNYSDSRKADITDDFRKIDKAVGFDLTQRLALYQLIKNSFMFRQGDLTDFLPREHMKDFDTWLDEKHKVLTLGQGEDYDALVNEIDQRVKTLPVQFDPKSHPLVRVTPGKRDQFADDYVESLDEQSGQYGGYLIANSREMNEGNKLRLPLDQYPDYVVRFVHDAGQGKSSRSEAKRLLLKLDRKTSRYYPVFNKYSSYLNGWEKDAMTSQRSLSYIPLHEINRLHNSASKSISIKVSQKAYYPNGKYFLPDGTLAQISRIDKTHIQVSVPIADIEAAHEPDTLTPYVPDYADATTDEIYSKDVDNFSNKYTPASSKREALTAIAQNSVRQPFVLLAKAIAESDYAVNIDSGNLSRISSSDTKALGFKDKFGFMPSAVTEKPTGDITLVNEKVKYAKDFERYFLHEIIHDTLHEPFRKIEKGYKLTEAEQKYTDAVSSVFLRVKRYVNDNRITIDVNGATVSLSSHPAFKNLKEFSSEALTNPLIQSEMMKIPGEGKRSAGIWHDFVVAVKDFFDRTFGKSADHTTFEDLVHATAEFSELSKKANVKFSGSAFDFASEPSIEKKQEKENRYYGRIPSTIGNHRSLIESITGADLSDRYRDVVSMQKDIIDSANSNFHNTGEYFYRANGKRYDIHDITNLNEVARKAEQVIADRDSYEPEMRDRLVGYLSSRNPDYLDSNLQRNKEFIENNFTVNPNDEVSTFDKIRDKHESLKFFGSDFNPLVISSKGSDGKTYMSIQDVTNRFLNNKLVHSNRFQYLADVLLRNDKDVMHNMDLRLLKTEAGMRKFNTILAAMIVKSENPDVVFDKLTVSKTGGKPETFGIELADYLDEMQAILKHGDVYNNLPDSLKKLLDSPEFFSKENYTQNYVSSLASMYSDMQEKYFQLTDEGVAGAKSRYDDYRDMMTAVMANSQGHDIYKEDVERIIRQRMNRIVEYFDGDSQKLNSDKDYGSEFNLLSRSLEYIHNKGTLISDAKMGVDINKMDKYWKMNYNVMHPIMQWFRKQTMKGINTVLNNFIDNFRTDFIKQIEKYNKTYTPSAADAITDYGFKRFKKLFIQTKATDLAGNSHDVNSFDIHFRYTDKDGNVIIHPKTKEALANHTIGETEADFGGYIVKNIKDALIERRMDLGFTDAQAHEWYLNNWRDGMIPVITRRASEKIFSKDWKNGVAQYLTKFSSGSEIYDYIAQHPSNNPNKISDHFMFQSGSGLLGSEAREEMIGIKSNKSSGAIEVLGNSDDEISKNLQKNASEVEQNLETVMYYFMMNHYSKQALDSVMPVHYAAMNMIYNFEQSQGKQLPNLKAYIEQFTKFTIKGEREGSDIKIKLGDDRYIKLDDMINNVSGFMAASAIGLNVFADAKNLLVNNLNLASFANANTLAKNSSFFGDKELGSAMKTMFSDRKLAQAISWEYRASGMDRSSLINNQRFYSTKKGQLTGSFYTSFGQFAGDYQTRTAAMMAQMEKWGIMDAHSLNSNGELVYDETRDPRMYKNGAITEDGKVLKLHLLANLKAEGAFDGEVSLESKLPKAMDSEMQDSIKSMTDKWIMGGGYNDATRIPGEAYAFGKLLTTMKKYLADKAQNISQKTSTSSSIGNYQVVDKMVDGKIEKVAVFEGVEMEGLVQSFASLIKNARSYSKLGYKDISEMWKDQSDIRRMNVIQTLQNLAVVCTFMSIAPAVFGDTDEERNKRHQAFMTTKMYRSLQYSIADLVSGINPGEYFQAIQEPFFAITQLGKFADFALALASLDSHKINLTGQHASGAWASGAAFYNTLMGEDNKNKPQKSK